MSTSVEDGGGIDIEELGVEGERPNHALASTASRVGQVGRIGVAGEEGRIVRLYLAR